jgi:hypothetical protein
MLKYIPLADPFCFIIETFEPFPTNAMSHCGLLGTMTDDEIEYIPSGKYTVPPPDITDALTAANIAEVSSVVPFPIAPYSLTLKVSAFTQDV